MTVVAGAVAAIKRSIMSEANRPLFRELDAEDLDPEVTEVESLCMNCQSDGVTRFLLTKIPFYKEIVIMSFSCEHCGYENNETQFGGKIAERGTRITLRVICPDDLNRQVVKSDYTSVKIVELDFEIPAQTQKGEITTVESILERSRVGLAQDQPFRRSQDPELASQIDTCIERLAKLKGGSEPFTLVLEDISGNCFIENLNAPSKDPRCTTVYFTRTQEQNHELGIYTPEEVGSSDSALLHSVKEGEFPLENLEGEVLQFPTNCNSCNAPCVTNMKVTNIPHFKEVVIMATVCDACGYRTNEVKSGGGIEAKGVRMEVAVNNLEDLNRDVLKSETCELHIPELNLEVGAMAISGRFTTVEGLLIAMKDQLNENIFKDSQGEAATARLNEFMEQLENVIQCKKQVTLVLDDPAGNSYIQSKLDEGKPDDGLKIIHYDRTFEQNEELGINDMKTEGYES